MPGAYAATDSEKRSSFLRPLKNNGCKEETGTKMLLYAIGTSTTLESNTSPFLLGFPLHDLLTGVCAAWYTHPL